jgi:hypothetical protein
MPLTPGEFASYVGVMRALVDKWMHANQLLSAYERYTRDRRDLDLAEKEVIRCMNKRRQVRLAFTSLVEEGRFVERGLNHGHPIFRSVELL